MLERKLIFEREQVSRHVAESLQMNEGGVLSETLENMVWSRMKPAAQAYIAEEGQAIFLLNA